MRITDTAINTLLESIIRVKGVHKWYKLNENPEGDLVYTSGTGLMNVPMIRVNILDYDNVTTLRANIIKKIDNLDFERRKKDFPDLTLTVASYYSDEGTLYLFISAMPSLYRIKGIRVTITKTIEYTEQ